MVTARGRPCKACNSEASLQDLASKPVAQLGRMQAAVELLLRGLGEDPTREGLRDTPRRVAKAWLDIASGYTQECTRAFGKALFHEPIVSSGSRGMVVVRDITFAALSEATLLPFHGRCHIAYVPRDGVILGLSKLARVTKCLASRLQRQEGFTRDLMAAIQQEVGPHGVAVVVAANHLGPPCEPAAQVTSSVSGCFEDPASGLLLEFLTLLRLSGIAAAGSLLAGGKAGAAAAAAAAAAPAQLTQLEHFEPAAAASCDVAAAAAMATVGDLAGPCCGLPPAAAGISRSDMAAAVRELLEGVGEAPGRPGLKGSMERYVQWLYSATAGYHMTPRAPSCCACGPKHAAAADRAGLAGSSTVGPVATAGEASPEGPATPADHTPDSSCAASDDMSADEQPCCLEGSLAGRPEGALLDREHAQHGQHEQQQGRGGVRTFSTRFTSQCEHHLLPFYGTLRLAYTLAEGSAGAVAGASGEGAGREGTSVEQQLEHIVSMYSRRLQVQERLSHQVADAALAGLGASAVLVVVDSAHMCMVARGVEKHASTTLTTAARGAWAEDAAARTHAMEVLLHGAE